MEKIEITVIHYTAFGIRHNRAYINKTMDEIKKDLNSICNTGYIYTVTKYLAEQISQEDFGDKNDGLPKKNK